MQYVGSYHGNTHMRHYVINHRHSLRTFAREVEPSDPRRCATAGAAPFPLLCCRVFEGGDHRFKPLGILGGGLCDDGEEGVPRVWTKE